MKVRLTPFYSAIAGAVLSLLATAPASAATYDLGVLTDNIDYSQLAYQPPEEGDFTDLFTFTVPEMYSADLEATVRNFAFGQLLNIELLSLDLDGVAGTGNETSKTFSDLAAGSYTFEVSGNSTGYFGGLYKFSLMGSLSPVPEPETYAMMLTGLAVVSFMARRRRNDG